jgi:hypothetical protein
MTQACNLRKKYSPWASGRTREREFFYELMVEGLRRALTAAALALSYLVLMILPAGGSSSEELYAIS